MRCFDCPLKWTCALWFWDVWNINLELCDCIDDRLICLDNVFDVDQTLLDEWKRNHPKPKTYEYLGKTYLL